MADLGDEAVENLSKEVDKALNKVGHALEKVFNGSDKSGDKIESLESRANYAREMSSFLANERKAHSLEQEIPHAPMSR